MSDLFKIGMRIFSIKINESDTFKIQIRELKITVVSNLLLKAVDSEGRTHKIFKYKLNNSEMNELSPNFPVSSEFYRNSLTESEELAAHLWSLKQQYFNESKKQIEKEIVLFEEPLEDILIEKSINLVEVFDSIKELSEQLQNNNTNHAGEAYLEIAANTDMARFNFSISKCILDIIGTGDHLVNFQTEYHSNKPDLNCSIFEYDEDVNFYEEFTNIALNNDKELFYWSDEKQIIGFTYFKYIHLSDLDKPIFFKMLKDSVKQILDRLNIFHKNIQRKEMETSIAFSLDCLEYDFFDD